MRASLLAKAHCRTRRRRGRQDDGRLGLQQSVRPNCSVLSGPIHRPDQVVDGKDHGENATRSGADADRELRGLNLRDLRCCAQYFERGLSAPATGQSGDPSIASVTVRG